MNLSCHLDQKGISVGYADPDKLSNYKLKNVKESPIFSLGYFLRIACHP